MKRMLLAGAGLAALLGLGTVASAQEPDPRPPTGKMTWSGGMNGTLEQRFAEMDTKGDGAVTRPEYDAYRAKMRAKRTSRVKERRDGAFSRLDANSDGTLSRQEFDTPPSPPPPVPARGAEAGGPPLGYDPTGGGAPPPPTGRLRGFNGGPDKSRLGPDWFDRADANHDGKVTFAEAKVAMRAIMSERRGMRGHGRGGPDGGMAPRPQ